MVGEIMMSYNLGPAGVPFSVEVASSQTYHPYHSLKNPDLSEAPG